MGGMIIEWRESGWRKRQWSEEQVSVLYRCFAETKPAPATCSWREAKCSAFSMPTRFAPAEDDGACADACCHSGADCGVYKFVTGGKGCLLGAKCELDEEISTGHIRDA